jgi:signal transduction histidine kinase/ActR/RegA family two-component response regulator
MNRAAKSTATARIRLRAALAAATETIDRLTAENDQLKSTQLVLEEGLGRCADRYDFAPIGLLTLDAAGIIREANLKAASMLAIDARHAIGLTFASFVRDRRAFRRHLAECNGENLTIMTEMELVPRSGPVCNIDLVTRRAGSGSQYRAVLVDVTERVRLAAAERSVRTSIDARDTFIATLSHELRTPLAPVLAAVSSLRGGQLSGRDTGRLHEIIERNVKLQARLVDDLLDAARILRGKMQIEREATPLHLLVRGVVEMFAVEMKAKRLRLVIDLDASKQTVDGDPIRLRQLFWNLIGNALKFTPDGGQVAVRSWNSNERIAVEVENSGVGLTAATIARIFEPFEQSGGPSGENQRQGLGLGLAIARGIAELHDGRITASSAGRDRGARFVVDLPTGGDSADDRENPSRAAFAGDGAKVSAVRILLIEDHRDTAAALSILLRARGYAIETVATAKQALEANLAGLALVISDIGLPDGDGLSLFRELRQKRRIEAIALSGYGTERDVRASLDAGFAAHLTKPIVIETLVAAIEKVLSTGTVNTAAS